MALQAVGLYVDNMRPKGIECLIVASFIIAVHAVQIDTVPQLNLSQYVGRWYQVWRVLVDVATIITDVFTLDRCILIGLQNWLSRKDVIVQWQIVRAVTS